MGELEALIAAQAEDDYATEASTETFSVILDHGCYRRPPLPNIDDYDHDLEPEWELGADVLDEENA